LLFKIKKLNKFAKINHYFTAACKHKTHISFEFKGDKLYLKITAKKGGKYGGKETDF
jgi:hypothetical protein